MGALYLNLHRKYYEQSLAMGTSERRLLLEYFASFTFDGTTPSEELSEGAQVCFDLYVYELEENRRREIYEEEV